MRIGEKWKIVKEDMTYAHDPTADRMKAANNITAKDTVAGARSPVHGSVRRGGAMARGLAYSPPGRVTSPLALWVLGAIVLFLLAGCEETKRREKGDESLARAIAIVNNEKIHFEDFQNEYQLFLTQWDRIIKKDPRKKKEIKKLLLTRKIEEKLLDQEARRRGITVDNAELSIRLNLLMGVSNASDGGMEGWRQNIKQADWNRKFKSRLIHEKLVQREVLDKIRPTRAEMRAYYNRNRNSFRREAMVNVRHIAVGNRSTYNRVRRALRRKRNFIELVRKYSTTPDKKADGLLGWVTRGILPKEFDEVIFKMSTIGSISPRRKPVRTQMGFHIFRLEGRRGAGRVGFRRARGQIRRRLIRSKQNAAYRKWLDGLRKKATIKIDEALLAAD